MGDTNKGVWTAGPWKLNDRAPPGRRIFMPTDTVEIISAGERELVACLYRVNLFAEQDAANASLIAAAPCLYEALAKAAKVFRGYEQLHLAKKSDEGDAKAAVNGLLAEEIEAALARARGPS